MVTHSTPSLRDAIQWDVRSWSRALPVWQRAVEKLPRPATALGIGEREGGLSLWLALQGIDVVCTDLKPLPDATRALHERYGVADRIRYAEADATRLPFADASFDLVVFKSVIGALGTKELQAKALGEMHRVLRPGGVLLFAENLTGTRLHEALRKRFTGWQAYWRYLELPADRDLFAPFAEVELHSTGFLANLGRTEGQRDLLARFDALAAPLVPSSWRYIAYGVARKAGG